jgi:hypothetical protein
MAEKNGFSFCMRGYRKKEDHPKLSRTNYTVQDLQKLRVKQPMKKLRALMKLEGSLQSLR